MVEYPPYVDAYGQIKELFKKIKEAAVPPKFAQDFLSAVLGLKSSSYRPMIPLLKRMGFIDEANVPTPFYIEYRDDSKSKAIMARQVKKAYSSLFTAHEYAYKLNKEQIISKLITLLGVSKDDKTVPKVASTFLEFCVLSDFERKIPQKKTEEKKELKVGKDQEEDIETPTKLGISYTINLNLPATPDIEVFDAIFKSLKEHLLK